MYTVDDSVLLGGERLASFVHLYLVDSKMMTSDSDVEQQLQQQQLKRLRSSMYSSGLLGSSHRRSTQRFEVTDNPLRRLRSVPNYHDNVSTATGSSILCFDNDTSSGS